MTMVKKRSGEMQEYDRSKLEESMKRAGAKEDVARRVAERIPAAEGLATEEIRRKVTEELRKEDPVSADAYVMTRRLKAKVNVETPVGAARVSEHLMKMFEQQKILQASLYHGARREDVLAEPAHKNFGEIWINKAVLDRLAAQEGVRIAVRFRRNAGPQASTQAPPAQPAAVSPPGVRSRPPAPAQPPR